MFQLTPAHEAALKSSQRAIFVEELAVASYDTHPDDEPFTYKDARLKAAELVLRNAESKGYSTRGGLFFWLNLASNFGSEFHSDPQYREFCLPQRQVGEVHELESLSPIYDTISNYISEVHGGPENADYTRAALKLSVLFEQGSGNLQDVSSTEDVARHMVEIFPKKYHRHAGIYLQRLRDGVYTDKAATILQSSSGRDVLLIACLEMFFGHRFEADAFKPWIGKSLEKCRMQIGTSDPDLRTFFELFLKWIDPE